MHVFLPQMNAISTRVDCLLPVVVDEQQCVCAFNGLHGSLHFTLDGGRIVESGTHDELLKQNAAYTALWKLQTGETV